MQIVTTLEFNVTDETPVPSKTLISITPFKQRRNSRFRELRDFLRVLERDGKFKKNGRYVLTFANSLSYGLAYYAPDYNSHPPLT